MPPEKRSFEIIFSETEMTWRFVGELTGPDQVYECFPDPLRKSDRPDRIRFVTKSDSLREGEVQLDIHAIYQIEDDVLMICTKRNADLTPSKEYPAEFQSTERDRSDLMILKRVEQQ